MDLDRLGRGDMVDQGTIYRVFRYSETFIITPTEIIDPNDENQELTFSIKSLIAREELKQLLNVCSVVEGFLQRRKIYLSRSSLWILTR